MAELKAIMDEAQDNLASDHETHMVSSAKAMEEVWFQNHYELEPYALFVLMGADEEEAQDNDSVKLDPMGIEGDADATLAKCAQGFGTDDFGMFVQALTDLTATVALHANGDTYGYAARAVSPEDGSVFTVLAANAGVVMIRRYNDRLGVFYSEFGNAYTVDAPDDLTKQESTVLGATILGWTLPKRIAKDFPLGFRAMAIEAMMRIKQSHEEDNDK